jgi:hypothetical protein
LEELNHIDVVLGCDSKASFADDLVFEVVRDAATARLFGGARLMNTANQQPSKTSLERCNANGAIKKDSIATQTLSFQLSTSQLNEIIFDQFPTRYEGRDKEIQYGEMIVLFRC